MSAAASFAGLPRSKREVIDVPEMKREDKSLDKLLHVRKQRINRLERERNETREAWRVARRLLRQKKEEWRAAVESSSTFWQAARTEFFRMATTSGQFRKAKAVYERMKADAAECYVGCRKEVDQCRVRRSAFFDAKKALLQANRQQEKLSILRDEIRASNAQPEM